LKASQADGVGGKPLLELGAPLGKLRGPGRRCRRWLRPSHGCQHDLDVAIAQLDAIHELGDLLLDEIGAMGEGPGAGGLSSL
jgi:hypothetical protein